MLPEFREHMTNQAPRDRTPFKRLYRECSRYGV